MTILPAKQAHKKWRDHVLKYYLEFIPAEKESAIAKLIDEATERGVALAVYDVWAGEVYNGRRLYESICIYLDAMGYRTEHYPSGTDAERITIKITWDRPKEDW